MCGRFIRTSPAEVIGAELAVARFTTTALGPRYNVCPGEEVAAIVNDGAESRLGLLHWGLGKHINARAETIDERPAFREAFRRRRCLIVADGFYEWRKEGRIKTPHLIRLRSRRPFALAGIWERWNAPDGRRLPGCAIVTCEPNELMAPIHDRMPVILAPEARPVWLDPRVDDAKRLKALLVPYPAEQMEAFPVSRLVNSPRNDSPACIERDE